MQEIYEDFLINLISSGDVLFLLGNFLSILSICIISKSTSVNVDLI